MKGWSKNWTSLEGPYSQATKRSYGDKNKSGEGNTGEDSLEKMGKRGKTKRE